MRPGAFPFQGKGIGMGQHLRISVGQFSDKGRKELNQDFHGVLVQGSGFNWPHPDHFRLVFLPHEDDLREAIGRIARFLENYRKRHST